MADDAKQQLFGFLDKNAFRPATSHKPSSDKAALYQNTRIKVEKLRFRYFTLPSALKIKESFLNDLNSDDYKALIVQLKSFNFPTFEDLKDEFLKLCDTAGI